MPTPPNERRLLEQELSELPAQIAAYRRELVATPPTAEFKARRERLDWQIRHAEKRLVEVTARRAAIRDEAN
jgi:hypothetical protein